MTQSTEGRVNTSFEIVAALMKTPKTAQHLADLLGLTVTSVYYALRVARNSGVIFIGSFIEHPVDDDGWRSKPTPVYHLQSKPFAQDDAVTPSYATRPSRSRPRRSISHPST